MKEWRWARVEEGIAPQLGLEQVVAAAGQAGALKVCREWQLAIQISQVLWNSVDSSRHHPRIHSLGQLNHVARVMTESAHWLDFAFGVNQCVVFDQRPMR